VDVLNALSTGNGGTIELLYMQVGASTFFANVSDLVVIIDLLNKLLNFIFFI
jgi:hypothetical protein